MAMGRGSDTRMYAPRSESTNMLSSANEDENKYNPTSPEDNEKRADEKKLKDEYEKEKANDIKHLKIKPSQGLGQGPTLPTDPGLDDGNKRDDEREIGLQGGPAGSRGHLLDMATGAKTGTGSSLRTGEPMADAWSELLKNDDLERYLREQEERENAMEPLPVYQQMTNDILLQLWTEHQDENALDELTERQNEEVNNELGEGADETDKGMELANDNVVQEDMFGPAIPYADQIKYASEPMADAWSDLLKYDPDEELNDYITCAGCGTHGPLFSEKEIEAASNSGYKDKRKYFDITHGNFSYNDLINYHHETLHRQPEGQESPALCQHCEGVVNNNEHLFKEGMEYHPENELPPENIEYLHSEFDKSPTAGIPMPQFDDFFDRQDFYSQPTNVQTGEPMADAWSDLLKEENDEKPTLPPCPYCGNIDHNWDYNPGGLHYSSCPEPEEGGCGVHGEFGDNELAHLLEHGTLRNYQKSEPMAGAWSELLKTDTPGKMEGRRRREKRREFRPSTGQFKRPPGGQTPVGATMRRFRAHMRGIKGGKKTGLMKPHLSVEMSHRGIATKQPMSKDPKRYRQYMGQQEARKILGNVRTTYSPHARHSARSFTAGPTGGGRLTGLLPGQSGQMAQPALRPMRRPRMPRMRQPRMPGLSPPPQMGPPMSSVPSMPSMAPPPPPPPPQMMMSDERTNSDLLKSNRHANRTEMLALMRMLIQAQRVKDKMKKAGTAFEEGAVPAHPAGVQVHENEDEKNDGPTQNLETDSSRLGLDPAGYLSSKRGHMG